MFLRNATTATHLSSTTFSAKGDIFLLQLKASRSQTFMFELATAVAMLPLQLTRRNGSFQKVVQLILRQMSTMDQKICSQKVPVCLLWKSSCDHHLLPGMGNYSFTDLAAGAGAQLCTAETGAGWGWPPSSCTVGIFERKSVLGAVGLCLPLVGGKVYIAHNGSN